jgi:hypothetical protein
MSPCSSLKADWIGLPTTWHKTLELLHTGMAWLGYFCRGLPRSCCWSKNQTKELINHSEHITAKTTHSMTQQLYKHTFLLFSHLHWWVEEACWAQILLAGTGLVSLRTRKNLNHKTGEIFPGRIPISFFVNIFTLGQLLEPVFLMIIYADDMSLSQFFTVEMQENNIGSNIGAGM